MKQTKKRKVAIWCYYKYDIMELEQATAKFLGCMFACEGSEKERYANIFGDLVLIQKASDKKLRDNGGDFYNGLPVASDKA